MRISEENLNNLARYYKFVWETRGSWQSRIVTTMEILDQDTIGMQISFDLDMSIVAAQRNAFKIDDDVELPLPLFVRAGGPLLDISLNDDADASLSIVKKRFNQNVAALYLLGELVVAGFPEEDISIELFTEIKTAIKFNGVGQKFLALADKLKIIAEPVSEANRASLKIMREEFHVFDDMHFLCINAEDLLKREASHIVIKLSTLTRLQSNESLFRMREIGPTRLFAMKFPLPLVDFGEGLSGVHSRIRAPQGMVIDDFSVITPRGEILEDDTVACSLKNPDGKSDLISYHYHQNILELHDVGISETWRIDPLVSIKSPPIITLMLNPTRRGLLIPAFVTSIAAIVATLILLLKSLRDPLDATTGNEIAVYSILLSIVVAFVGTRREHILVFQSLYAARVTLVVTGVGVFLAGVAVGTAGYDSGYSRFSLALALLLSCLSLLTSGFQIVRIEVMRRDWAREMIRGMSAKVHEKYGDRKKFFYYARKFGVYVTCLDYLYQLFHERYLNLGDVRAQRGSAPCWPNPRDSTPMPLLLGQFLAVSQRVS